MRFEEVSPPVESRVLAIVTRFGVRLSEEINTLMGFVSSIQDEVYFTMQSVDRANVTGAVAQAVAPGGITSLLVATALLLRLLRYHLVRRRVSRLMSGVGELAAAGGGTEAHCHYD